jgi:hypothetical protein
MDDTFNLHRAIVVKDQLIMSALVAAGHGDCYLVKTQDDTLLGVFYETPELSDAIELIKRGQLTVDVLELWESYDQADTAKIEQWPHETANRQ